MEGRRRVSPHEEGRQLLQGFSFTKADRILKRPDFVALAQGGRKIQDAYFIVKYRPSRLGRMRLGITVTKKVGKAVTRNRIKRLTREFFRLNRHDMQGPQDINIIATRQAAELSGRQAHAALRRLFQKIEAS